MQITATVLFYSNQILKRLNRGNANTLHNSVNIFSIQSFTEYTKSVPRCQKISVKIIIVRYLIYYLLILHIQKAISSRSSHTLSAGWFKTATKSCSCYLGKHDLRQGSCSTQTSKSEEGTSHVPVAAALQSLEDCKGTKVVPLLSLAAHRKQEHLQSVCADHCLPSASQAANTRLCVH